MTHALLLLLAALAAEPRPRVDLPSLSPRAELVRQDCTTEQHRREVTLFGSGTIRLRDGMIGAEATGLFNLAPLDFTGFLNRLLAEDLKETGLLDRGLDGAWISRCELTLELPNQPKRVYTYGQYASLPLNFSRLVRIVDELAAKVPDLKLSERLPDDFKAKRGDLVRRLDGALFRVVGYTSDGKGVELEAQDFPLALYLSPEQLRHDFVALVERDGKKP